MSVFFWRRGERSTAILVQPNRPGDPRSYFGGVAGYTGTQVFSTYYAGHDPGEPNHCGVIGGASFWFAYVAPEDGLFSTRIRAGLQRFR